MIGASKLTQDDVDIIRDLLKMGKTHQSIANLFGVSREHITKIHKGHRWNKPQHSFIMKDELEQEYWEDHHKPKTGNDFREFSPLPIKNVEIQDQKEVLDMDQKYYLVKFIESLTGKKIKKMIVEF